MSSKTAPIIIVKQQDTTNTTQTFDVPFSPPAPDDFYFNKFLYANTKPKDEVDLNVINNETKTTSIIQPQSIQQQQLANKTNLLRISLLKKGILDSISPSPTPPISSSNSNDGSDSQESSETNTPSTSPFQQRKQIQQQHQHQHQQQIETIQPKQASEFVNKMFQTAFQTNHEQHQHHHHNKKCDQIKTFRELNSMVPDSL